MRWYQTISVINPVDGAQNEYGDVTVSDGTPVESPAWVQPLDATEDEISRDTRVSRFHIIVPKETVVSALSKVVWEGRNLEVIGEPQPFHNRNGLHHLEFDAREVLG